MRRHHLRFFMCLGALVPSAASAQGGPAEVLVLSTVGNVELVAPSAPPRRPTARERLTAGTRIIVHEGAEATLRYEGVGDLQVEARSELVLPGAAPGHGVRGGHEAHDSTLSHGATRVVVDPGRTLRLDTPAGVTSFGAGEFRVQVDASRNTRVASYRGRAQVGGPRGAAVPQGHGARFDDGHGATPTYPPFRLPAAPVWAQPFPPSVLTLSGQASVEARFASPPNPRHPPRGWVLELARDARFDDVVFEREAPAQELTFRAEGLAEGEYFARVSSVNIEHFEGLPSSTQRFRVAAPRVIPSGPGRRAEVLVPAGIFCRLDGETTLEVGVPFALVPGRAHALECADNAALRGATRIPVSAERSGEILHTERLLEPGWSPAGGTALLELRLQDPSGRPVSYANVSVRGVGVTVAPMHEASERGYYVAEVRYPANTPVRVEFTVNDYLRFTQTLGGASR